MSTQEQLNRFLAFLQEDSNNIRLLTDAANCAYDIGQLNDVLDLTARGLELDSGNNELRAIRALSMLALGDFKTALVIFQHLVDEGKHNPSILYNLAYCLALNGQYEQTLPLLEDAIKLYEDFPQMLHLKMRSLYFLEELEQAIDLGKQAIQLNPGDATVHELLSSLYIDEADFAAAEHHANLAIQANPKLALAHTSMGTVALTTQDDIAALSHFDHAININQKDGRAWLGKAMALMLQHDLPQAEVCFKSALTYMPTHLGTYQALAWCQIGQNNLQAAEATTKEALAIDDTFSENHGTLAVLSVIRGDTNLAKTQIRTALGLDKNSFSGLYAQALLLQSKGDAHRAQQIIDGMLDAPDILNQQSLRQFLMQHMKK